MKSNSKSLKKWMKRLTAIALVAVLALGSGGVDWGGGSNRSYADEEHWAEPYMDRLVSQGVLRGDPTGQLNPDDYITRAEFVAMVNRAFGYTQKGTTKFKDVDKNAWYADDISIAANQGYFEGTDKNSASPDSPLKREEAVVMLCRALKIEGITDGYDPFLDSRDFSNWSRDYINAAIDKNYINGYPDNTFRPSGAMTRGEMAKILATVAGDIVKNPGDNSVGHTPGNVSVVNAGSNLDNTYVSGDLYITAGVGLGATTLQGVTVAGDLIISGTGESENGENSIILNDCTVNRLILDSVEGKPLSLQVTNDTDIKQTLVKCNAYLEEDANDRDAGFRDVVIQGPSGTKVSLSGNFNDVKLQGKGNILSIEKGFVDRVTVDENAAGSSIYIDEIAGIGDLFLDTGTPVTGKGTIDSVVINADGTTITMMPDDISVRPGVTANVGGQTMGYQDAEINSRSPKIMSGYPNLYEAQPTSADILVKTNKPGKVYWVVREAGTGDSLSKEDIKTPKNGTVVKNANLGVVTEKEATVKVSGLKAGVEYEFVAVFTDLQDKNSSIKTEEFTTIDNIVPTFLSGYPKIKTSDNTSLTLTANMSKNCNIYWAILPTKSVAPTVDMVVNQEVPGAIHSGIASGVQMNIEKDLLMDALQENTTYDIYMVAKDDSDNKSRLAKLTATTADKTPPEFIYGPKRGTAGATNVQVNFTANEDGSLYWIAVKRGEVFPQPVPPSTTPPALNSPEAIEAVILGNDVEKKGKVSMTGNLQASFNIDSLEKEMEYDVYMVLQDKAGNNSDVTKMTVKPNDTTAPTATMVFPDTIEGKPLATSSIIVQFSEIVSDVTTGKELEELAKTSPEALESNIAIWDMSQNMPERLPITYNALKIYTEDGKTLIEFTPDNVSLASGNTYQVELNKIMDSSGNRMQSPTRLPSFVTVAPLVNFEKATPDVHSHIAFTVKPQQQNTTDNIFYDTFLSCNRNIVFNLVAEDLNGNRIPEETKTGLSLAKGKAYSLNRLLDHQVGGRYELDTFSALKPTKYQIQITSLDDNTSPKSWDGELTLTAKGLIGSDSDMQNAINYLASRGFEGLDKLPDVVSVEFPSNFSRTVLFSDTEVPTFASGYPTFDPGETKIKINAMTDKPATLYYIAAKVGNVMAPDGSTVSQAAISTTPSATMMQSGIYDGSTIISGNFALDNGDVLKNETIEGLDPLSTYRIFYMLKGTMPEPGMIGSKDVTLQTIASPQLDHKVTYQPVSGTEVDVKVRLLGDVGQEAKLYWAIYKNNTMVAPDSSDLIKPDGTKTTDFGNLTIKSGEETTIRCKNLEQATQYQFYAVAVKDLSDVPSNIVSLAGIVPLDNVPPTVTISPSVNLDASGTTYSGSIEVLFSEPMFYYNSKDGTPIAFNLQSIKDGKSKITAALGMNVWPVEESSQEVDLGNGEKAIQSLQLAVTNFKKNGTITFPILGDSVTKVGKLVLTMKVDADDNVTFEQNWIKDE